MAGLVPNASCGVRCRHSSSLEHCTVIAAARRADWSATYWRLCSWYEYQPNAVSPSTTTSAASPLLISLPFIAPPAGERLFGAGPK
jgi:hypothetical protein